MKSIQNKIIAMLLFVVVLSTTIVGVIGIVTTSRVLHESADRNMKLLCQTNTEKLNTMLSRVEESVITLSQHVTTELDSAFSLSKDEYRKAFISEIERIAINHLKSTEGALSIYFYINHDLVENPSGFFWSKLGKDDTLKTHPINDASLYDENDIEHAGWWYIPTTKREAVWIDTYHNMNVDVHMFSYVVPVYKNGDLYGVIGMDVSCDYIADAAKAIKVYESGFAAILDKDASIVYHPKYEFGSNIEDTEKEFEKTARIILTQKDNNSLLSYTIDGVSKKMSYSALKNGMNVCIIAPDSEIYRQQIELQHKIILLIVATIAITLLFAIMFARNLTRPIKSLNYAARQMTEGNLNVIIRPTTRDEVGELTLSFAEAQKKLKNQMDSLYIEAHRDGLTGVNNKTALAEIEKEINSHISDGISDLSFAIGMFDVNGLKITNDILGHNAGDNLLKAISAQLIKHFNRNNVYRAGGDEFVVVLRNCKESDFENKIASFSENVKTKYLENYPQIKLSCAVGTAVYEAGSDKSFSEVLTRADHNMYKNKALQKNDEAIENSKSIRKLQIDKYLEFLSIISESTDEYLFLLEIDNDTTHFLGNVSEMFGICGGSDSTATLSELLEIVHPSDRKAVRESMQKVFSHISNSHNMICRWINKNGETVWVNVSGKVVLDDNGNPFIMIGSVSQDALKFLYNPLTGLFNKTKQTRDFQENTAVPFKSFMLINVDGTTNINLTHGRKYGDEVLCTLAKILENKFPISSVYHMELDRFAILLDTDSEQEIQGIFDEIQSAIDGSFTVSAAVVPNSKALYVNMDNIYDYARQVLKENKQRGVGILSFFSKEYITKKLSAIELLEELENSVQNNFEGFYLCYQPQVDAKTYSVCSAEALIRYRSPSKGNVFPNDFIPILEHTGLINKVGLWVLETALLKCKEWRKVRPDFRVSVNFSTVQFANSDLATNVLDILKKVCLPGSALTIEITESMPVEETDVFTNTFSLFRSHDIAISIDDFGTGYSNLAYLEKIHADEIKIDRMFIQGIDESTYNYRVINNIIDFAKTNSLKVCLEGVERIEELAAVESLMPDLLQGYLFEKPITAEEFDRIYFTKGSSEYTERQNFMRELNKHREKRHIVHLNTNEILSQIDIGLWVIRVNENDGTREMFADSTMHKLLGSDENLTPAECYFFWYSRIKDGYENTVDSMVNAMKESGKVNQAEYPWLHPERGEIIVRCTGKCVKNSDGIITFEGFHRVISDMGKSFQSI